MRWRDKTVEDAERRLQEGLEAQEDNDYVNRMRAEARRQTIWCAYVPMTVALVVLVLALLAGCATTQTPYGPVYVLRGHPELCEYWAEAINAERIAVTVGRPFACDAEAAADFCLMAHENVHTREQKAHPGGVPGWVRQWVAEYMRCLGSGRSTGDCHDAHSMEQDAIIAQRICEATRAAGGGL